MENLYDFRIAHPEVFRQLSVRDMLIVYYTCPQVDKVVHVLSHLNEIAFTLSGKKTLHHRNKSWELTENTSLFIRSSAYSQEKYDFEGWKILAFCFTDDFLRRSFSEYRQYLPLKNLPEPCTDMLMDLKVNETTRAFFYAMLPYFSQQVPPTEALLELKFKELLFNLFSDPANLSFLAYSFRIEHQEKIPISEVMEANYTYNLTIGEFAKIAQRSVAVFKREFREKYSMSPGRWLTQKRLDYAKYLLDSTSKNISEITDCSGFENLSHFSRIFREKFAVSPQQYRRKNILR